MRPDNSAEHLALQASQATMQAEHECTFRWPANDLLVKEQHETHRPLSEPRTLLITLVKTCNSVFAIQLT